MKKFFLYLGVTALLVAGAGDLFAGSIDYRSNQSADYVRTFSRNAATDAADAAYYNPAGTVKLADGLFLNAGNQTVLKDYSMEAGGEEYTATNPTLILPNIFGVYKSGQMAGFLGFSIPAGGGTLEYPDGTAGLGPLGVTDIEGSSVYYGLMLGGAYAVTDMISLSLAGRYIMAKTGIKASVYNAAFNFDGDVDVEENASGYGGIIGINIAATPEMNIGIKYETATKLEFETTVNEDATNGFMYHDGAKERKDLPALLALGVNYSISPEMIASFSLNYYFITQADQGEDGTADADGYDDDYTNGYDAAIALEYAVTPKELILSVGFNYSKVGGSEDTYSDLDYALDSNSVCGGVKYYITPELDLTLGLAYTMYTEGENAAGTTTYNKTATTIAVGANYKAM